MRNRLRFCGRRTLHAIHVIYLKQYTPIPRRNTSVSTYYLDLVIGFRYPTMTQPCSASLSYMTLIDRSCQLPQTETSTIPPATHAGRPRRMNQEDVSIEHPSGLLALPDELLRAILDHISPLDLASIQTTCSRLNIISADTLLWESACLSWFRWWDKNHDFETKRHNSAYHGWKQLFANRWRSHRNAQKALAAMTDSETNRLDRIADILNTGYDAKDVLVDAFRDAPNSDLYLSQRFVAPVHAAKVY